VNTLHYIWNYRAAVYMLLRIRDEKLKAYYQSKSQHGIADFFYWMKNRSICTSLKTVNPADEKYR